MSSRDLYYGWGADVVGARNQSEELTVTYDEDDRIYLVVVNAEEKYSIWPKTRPLAKGWNSVGEEGVKRHCQDYIDKPGPTCAP